MVGALLAYRERIHLGSASFSTRVLKLHGWKHPAHWRVHSSICPVCLKQFHEYSLVIQHLLSKGCKCPTIFFRWKPQTSDEEVTCRMKKIALTRKLNRRGGRPENCAFALCFLTSGPYVKEYPYSVHRSRYLPLSLRNDANNGVLVDKCPASFFSRCDLKCIICRGLQ